MSEQSTLVDIPNPHQAFMQLKETLALNIVGQEKLLTRLLVALLADGHLLVEGAPGLAKTRAIKCLAEGITASFHRIQFTPDLLPGDITGNDIFRPQTSEFVFQPGPIFHNLVLADEINRAPAKVQSALLEAMAERQVTIGQKTYPCPDLFLVMATQNPLEQEGTYPLPEAQLDRFLLHVTIDYPDREAERKILYLARNEAKRELHTSDMQPVLNPALISQARHLISEVHLSEALEDYCLELILATREPKRYSDEWASLIRYGASPRATIALDCVARCHAWLEGRDFVEPQDIQTMVHDVLRHRLVLHYSAIAREITTDNVIDQLLDFVPVP